jgi:hypothetical protein
VRLPTGVDRPSTAPSAPSRLSKPTMLSRTNPWPSGDEPGGRASMAYHRVLLCRQNALIDVHIVYCVTPCIMPVGVSSGVKGAVGHEAVY